MDYFAKLPPELWLIILINLYEEMVQTSAEKLQTFFALRELSFRMRQLIDNHPEFWSVCLIKESLQQARQHKVPYAKLLNQYYETLQSTITNYQADSKNSSDIQNVRQTLKQLAFKNGSYANLIVRSSKFRVFFLDEKYLSDIVDIAIEQVPIALFILQDAAFKDLFLKHIQGLSYIIKLAHQHKSIALLLCQQDGPSQNIMAHNIRNNIKYMSALFAIDTEIFIAFFQNKTLKTHFLECCAKQDQGDMEYTITFGFALITLLTDTPSANFIIICAVRSFNILCSPQDKQYWLSQPTSDLIDHIVAQLIAKSVSLEQACSTPNIPHKR